MKWIFVIAFYFSCYNPDSIEILYEGSKSMDSYSYHVMDCGSEVHESEGYDDDSLSEYRDAQSEYTPKKDYVFIPWIF
jgi:hypothetical protein